MQSRPSAPDKALPQSHFGQVTGRLPPTSARWVHSNEHTRVHSRERQGQLHKQQGRLSAAALELSERLQSSSMRRVLRNRYREWTAQQRPQRSEKVHRQIAWAVLAIDSNAGQRDHNPSGSNDLSARVRKSWEYQLCRFNRLASISECQIRFRGSQVAMIGGSNRRSATAFPHTCRTYVIAFVPALKTKSEDHRLRPNQVNPTSSENLEGCSVFGRAREARARVRSACRP